MGKQMGISKDFKAESPVGQLAVRPPSPVVGRACVAPAHWISAIVETLTGREVGWDPGEGQCIDGGNTPYLRSYKDRGIGRLLCWRLLMPREKVMKG